MTLPGGEGFRIAYIADCTPILVIAAQWLEGLHDMKWTPAHAGFHRFKTIGGSIKPNDDGTMPTTVAEVTSIRPLCRPCRIQVVVTSPLAQKLFSRPTHIHLPYTYHTLTFTELWSLVAPTTSSAGTARWK